MPSQSSGPVGGSDPVGRHRLGGDLFVPARPWRLGLLRIAIKLHLVVPNDNHWDDGPRGEM